MTLLVVLILVVLWAAVLGPRIVRRLREREPLGSVDSFYHELHLLDRAAPKTVAPANRLETAYAGRVGPGASGYPSVSSMPGRPSLVLLRPLGAGDQPERPDRPADGRPVDPGLGANRSLAARDRAYRVRQSRRRRRDIFLALLATIAVTGLLGTMHSFRSLWDLTVVAGVLLVAYVALVVRAEQMAAASRARPRAADPGLQRRRVDRQTVTGRSDRQLAGYGGGYGEDGYGGDRYDQDGYGYGDGGYGYGGYGYGYGGAQGDGDERVVTLARSGHPGGWDDEPYPVRPQVAAGV